MPCLYIVTSRGVGHCLDTTTTAAAAAAKSANDDDSTNSDRVLLPGQEGVPSRDIPSDKFNNITCGHLVSAQDSRT